MNYLVFLFALLGVLVHLLMKFRDSMTKKEKFPWAEHTVWAAISIIVVVVVIIGWQQAKTILMIDAEMTELIAFFLGYFGDSVIKNLSKFNPISKGQE